MNEIDSILEDLAKIAKFLPNPTILLKKVKKACKMQAFLFIKCGNHTLYLVFNDGIVRASAGASTATNA